MAKTFHLNVVDSHQEIFSGKVSQVVVPGVMGGLCILAGHAQLISTIMPGELRYISVESTGSVNEETSLFVSGGILEVQPMLTTVLADTLIRSKDIDAEAARESMERAQQRMAGINPGSVDLKTLQTEIAIISGLLKMSRSKIKHKGL